MLLRGEEGSELGKVGGGGGVTELVGVAVPLGN